MSAPNQDAPRSRLRVSFSWAAVARVVRLIVPLSLVPLCIAANLLATAPWLRAFPVSVAGAPLYGAAVLSVLIPLVTVRLRRRLWLCVLIDLVAFSAYTLLVVLQDPTALGTLLHGLYRGPAEVLSFALPLVSPRSLMVAPVALTWLTGALAGECMARRWYTMLPYIGFLVGFGLAYAATQRAAGSDIGTARVRETLLAAGLLVTLLLLRVAESWLRQDETAESTQPDGRLPLRSLIVGTVAALVVAVVASLVVQASAFPKRSHAPQRVPSVNQSNPLTPLSFIAGVRPSARSKDPTPVFDVTVDHATPGYFAIANLDSYNGSGWTFRRTFRPSGGVLPDDTDVDLRSKNVVTQRYRILSGPLTRGRLPTPWMPFLYRAQKVTGTAVNIDPASGMIVPAGRLAAGESYTVRSAVGIRTFNQLKLNTAAADLATPPIDTQLPVSLRLPLGQVVNVLTGETHTSSLPAMPFLQALQRDLQQNYALSPAAQGSSSGVVASASASPSPNKGQSSAATGSPSSNSAAKDLAGGTGFADVLASIVGASRAGTPEQFATLVALIARSLDVPARVVTGFRVTPVRGSTLIGPGAHVVTAADAWTWVEIPVVGVGWVVLDPSPQRLSANNTPTQSAAPPPPAASVSASPNPLLTQANGGNAISPPSPASRSNNNAGISLLVALLIAAGLLIVLLVVLLLARKPIRAARRRRAADPRTRLIGAWEESIDVLTEAGLPDLRALTSSEIAHLAGERFGTTPQEQAASLGSAANAVAYSSATVVEPADADAAWEHVRVLRKSVRQQLGPRDRVVATLRYHRTRAGDVPRSPNSWAAAAVDVLATSSRDNRRRRNYQGRRRRGH